MPPIAIFIGLALELLGILAYRATGAMTSLIPTYVGAALFILGLIGMKVSLRKHAMHVAAMVGLLGALAALGRLVPALMNGNYTPWSLMSLVGMAVLCGVFVVLCVRSFVAARKARVAGGIST